MAAVILRRNHRKRSAEIKDHSRCFQMFNLDREFLPNEEISAQNGGVEKREKECGTSR